METKPKKYFAFFRYLKQKFEAVDERQVRDTMGRISQICAATGKCEADAGMDLMVEAFDALQPQKIRVLLYVLESRFGVPLHEIVDRLHQYYDENAK